MRAHGEPPAKRLLDGCLHSLCVAGMSTAGDVDRRERRHQRLLCAAGDVLGHLAHVAIQIYVLHPTIASFKASSPSCSRSNARAVSHPTRSNRTSSRGRSCPTCGKSAEITLAILG